MAAVSGKLLPRKNVDTPKAYSSHIANITARGGMDAALGFDAVVAPMPSCEEGS